MKDDDEQFQGQDIDELGAGTHAIQRMDTLVLDTSSPKAMYDGLVATLGDVYGIQMFSNLTGIHMLDGKLLPSCITDYDILH